MKLTEFGKLVRKARIEASVNMNDMAGVLGVSPAFLSGMESGRKKIADEWVKSIREYFNVRGVDVGNLEVAADVSNQAVSLEKLTPAHQMLVAGFARSSAATNGNPNLEELERLEAEVERLQSTLRKLKEQQK